MDKKTVGLLLWDFTDPQEIKSVWMETCFAYCHSLIVAVPERSEEHTSELQSQR